MACCERYTCRCYETLFKNVRKTHGLNKHIWQTIEIVHTHLCWRFRRQYKKFCVQYQMVNIDNMLWRYFPVIIRVALLRKVWFEPWTSSVELKEYSWQKRCEQVCINGRKAKTVFPEEKWRLGLQIKVGTEIVGDLEGEDHLWNLTFRILNVAFSVKCGKALTQLVSSGLYYGLIPVF